MSSLVPAGVPECPGLAEKVVGPGNAGRNVAATSRGGETHVDPLVSSDGTVVEDGGVRVHKLDHLLRFVDGARSGGSEENETVLNQRPSDGTSGWSVFSAGHSVNIAGKKREARSISPALTGATQLQVVRLGSKQGL